MLRILRRQPGADRAADNMPSSLPPLRLTRAQIKSMHRTASSFLDAAMREADRLYAASRYVEAAQLYRRVMDGCEAEWGPCSRERLAVVSNLGMCLFDMQQVDESLDLFTAMIGKSADAYGAADDLTITLHNNMCSVLMVLGRNSEAEAGLRTIIQLLEDSHGLEHDKTLTSITNLSTCLVKNPAAQMPAFDEAVALLEKVHAAYTRMKMSTKAVQALISLANVLTRAGKFGQALVIRHKVLAIHLDQNDMSDGTLYAYKDLAYTLYRMGNLEECLKRYRDAYRIAWLVHGPDSAQAASVVECTKRVLVSEGKDQEAAKVHIAHETMAG